MVVSDSNCGDSSGLWWLVTVIVVIVVVCDG